MNKEEKDLSTSRFEIKDEAENLAYLHRHKFAKTLQKLVAKLKNKKVVLYGAGAFLEVIKKNYDLSGLDVIGIADKKYQNDTEKKEFLGYKTYAPKDIVGLNPDYVIVSTKLYISIVADLYENLLKESNIKIKPLVHKSFFTLFREALK